MRTRIVTAAAAALAVAGCAIPCPNVRESGCVVIVDQPAQQVPTGWRYWVEDDGDPVGYWANREPAYTAPRLAYSKGPTGDIYQTFVCAYSEGGQA